MQHRVKLKKTRAGHAYVADHDDDDVGGAEVYMSPKNEYFCITPKNGFAQECGSKGGPHGNISA